MEMTLGQLSAKMLDLSIKNRAILAKKLLDSLESPSESPEENDQIWAREAERRLQEIKEGGVTRPANEVRRSARERFKG